MKKKGKTIYYFCVPCQKDERKEKFIDSGGGLRHFNEDRYPNYEKVWPNLINSENLDGFICCKQHLNNLHWCSKNKSMSKKRELFEDEFKMKIKNNENEDIKFISSLLFGNEKRNKLVNEEIESMEIENEIERYDKKEKRKLMELEEEAFEILTTKFKDIKEENKKIIHKDEIGLMNLFGSKSKLISKNQEFDLCKLIRTALKYIDTSNIRKTTNFVSSKMKKMNLEGLEIEINDCIAESTWEFEIAQNLKFFLGKKYIITTKAKRRKYSQDYDIDIEIFNEENKKKWDIEIISEGIWEGENFSVHQHIHRQSNIYWENEITQESVIVAFYKGKPKNEEFLGIDEKYKNKNIKIMYVIYYDKDNGYEFEFWEGKQKIDYVDDADTY